MLTNHIKSFVTSFFTTGFVLCLTTTLHAHPRIIADADDSESYAVSFKRNDAHEPEFASISQNEAIELTGTIHGLTIASTDGFFGKFDDLAFEDADYAIVFLKESGILLLATSLEDGDQGIWTNLQHALNLANS